MEFLPCCRVNVFEVLRNFVKSFVPSEPLPTLRCAAHGIFQPVFIVVKILQRNGLRADVSAAEWIVFVTTDVEQVSGGEFGVRSLDACCCLRRLRPDLNPAYRFA